MTTKGLFNYSAADACGESPSNSDPSNLSNEFAFTAIRTSLASYEDKGVFERSRPDSFPSVTTPSPSIPGTLAPSTALGS